MKLRADLKLVKQLDYMPRHYVDLDGNKCLGCVFAATQYIDNSLCDRTNDAKLMCGADMIWVFEDDKTNFRMKEKE